MAKKKGSPKNEATPNKKGADSARTEVDISSCMEAAITPCVSISEVVDNAEINDMCADLSTTPLLDEDDAYDELAKSPCTDVATPAACTEVASPAACTEVATATSCTELATAASCTELATTASSKEVAKTSSCTDVTVTPAMEITAKSAAEIQENESGVSDLVAQQLRQMMEEGGATATCASAGSFTGTHTMNLNVKAGAVDMNLSTVTEANQELIELKTQIELQQRLLADAQDRLDVANQRIGFLESELARKDREKQESSGWLKSLFGI